MARKSDVGSASQPAAPLPAASLAEELERLEDIVRQLEGDDVELDDALGLFEEGVKRLRAARDRLAQAELKVQSVLESAAGDLVAGDIDL